jgi:hypothetical protein
MLIPPLPPLQAPIWRPQLAAAAMLALLTACAPNGDFGEVRPMLVSDNMHDWLGFNAGRPTFPSSFELTDDEHQLRDLAFPLIEPPYKRQQWGSVVREYGMVGRDRQGPFDRTQYATHLFDAGHRSPAVLYSRITDDIRDDMTRLPQFFETAGRVVDIDQKRQKSLGYIPDLSPAERADAMRRVRENASVISLVNEKLSQRVSSYRFALERMVIMTPSPQAAEVERVLNQLQALIVRYRTQPAPTWQREQSLVSAR